MKAIRTIEEIDTFIGEIAVLPHLDLKERRPQKLSMDERNYDAFDKDGTVVHIAIDKNGCAGLRACNEKISIELKDRISNFLGYGICSSGCDNDGAKYFWWDPSKNSEPHDVCQSDEGPAEANTIKGEPLFYRVYDFIHSKEKEYHLSGWESETAIDEDHTIIWFEASKIDTDEEVYIIFYFEEKIIESFEGNLPEFTDQVIDFLGDEYNNFSVELVE